MTGLIVGLPFFENRKEILQGTTTVTLGDFNFFHGDRSAALVSIQKLKEYLHVEDISLVLAQQVHGNTITRVTHVPEENVHFFSETDALVTDQSGLMLGILTADCIPVFLYDVQKRVIGVVHAGWRGVAKKIVPACVEVMKKDYNSSPGDLMAGIGPYIAQECYEVEESTALELGIKTMGKAHIDLGLLVRDQLLQLDIPKENIAIVDFRTYASPLFFSYRKQGKAAGRMLSFLLLR